jgi:GntR family transcriptional regulator
MARDIDRWSEEPYYAQLARFIRADIESGELQPGDPLRSEAHYMQAFGLARNTVRMALAALRESGHVETHKRRGSRVLGREHWQA